MSHSDTKSSGHCSASKAAAKRQPPLSREVDRLHGEIARLQIELREQTQRSMLALEAERASLARELHDNFGQFLTVIEMELDGLINRADAAGDIRARMAKLKSLAADARHDVARIASQIRPVSLDGVRLQDACLQLLSDWKDRTSLDFDVHVSIGDRVLPPLVETVLFRVLQEAITNVVKHAKATRMGVILQALPHNVQVVVEDDGIGLISGDSDIAVSSRFGLLGMRERVALVGGTLEIESVPGKGTTLLINVPL